MAKADVQAKRFTVGQILYREKLSRHGGFEGEVEVIAVGRKWIAVNAPGSHFGGRFDAETMYEDNRGIGAPGGLYWLSKAHYEQARAVDAAWSKLRERFDDSLRVRARRPEHLGLAEIAQINAIMDGVNPMDEIATALRDAVDSLQYVQDKHPEASGWGVRAERIEKIDAVLTKYWPTAG